jgi:hypothetical protein
VAGESKNQAVGFKTHLSDAPTMIYALSWVDIILSDGVRAIAELPRVSGDGFTMNLKAGNQCRPFDIQASWLTLPNNGIHFESGVFESWSLGRDIHENVTQRITFAEPFSEPPEICCWFVEINCGAGWHSLKTYTKNITKEGFTLKIDTWAGRSFDGAKVQWLAFDTAEDGKRVKRGLSTITRGQGANKEDLPFYGTPFSRPPATIIGITELDLGDNAGFRLQCVIHSATKDRLAWEYGTWADTNMDHAVFTWLAVE